MQIRVAEEKDAAALVEIYSYYVEKTAITFEYETPSTEEFTERIHNIKEKYPYIVAEENGEILGFADMDGAGYLDRLYVHKDHQGRGVATALCSALEAACPVKNFTTHASLTARPFFESRGYQVLRRQTVVRHGISLENFVMEKRN